MDNETMTKCVVRALNSIIEKNEGIIVELDSQKYLVMKTEENNEEVYISEVTEEDSEFFEDLNEGEIVFFEEE